MKTLLCGILLLVAVCGCASTGAGSPPDMVKIRMTPEGELFLAEKPVLLARLPKAIRAQGAVRSTAVYIEVPAGVSTESIRTITSTLATAGYTRVVFTKPLRKSASAAAP